MMKRKYASEHDISSFYDVERVPVRVGLIKLYNALSSIISDGFSDTVKITLKEGIDLYKSINVSITHLAQFFKKILYHVHGEEDIEICLSTNDFDAFIDVKCNYKFTKEEISDIEAALTDTGLNFKIGEDIHLETPLRGCGVVTAYAFGTDEIRHYMFYIIHSVMFKIYQ
ncbi:MAG: hypothetical protein IKV20_01650 [Clostridia bacterium]|nr:hypothetical protein [Clostridia bacterium]